MKVKEKDEAKETATGKVGKCLACITDTIPRCFFEDQSETRFFQKKMWVACPCKPQRHNA